MEYRSWLEIDKSAIRHNLAEARKIIGDKVKLMAVVKANAYGHGLAAMGRLAFDAGADWLGVDALEEALALREAKIKAPILVMGYVLQKNLPAVIEKNISLGVYNKETIKALGSLKNESKIHLKIETGTMRKSKTKKP